jgi:hypothetical protein
MYNHNHNNSSPNNRGGRTPDHRAQTAGNSPYPSNNANIHRGGSDAGLQMLPIHHSPTTPRYAGNGQHNINTVSPLDRSATRTLGLSSNTGSPRALPPSPGDEAQIVRQRSQGQIYPAAGVQNVSFAATQAPPMPMPIPISMPTQHTTPPPHSHVGYNFSNPNQGFGSHSNMAPPASYPYFPPQNNSPTLHYGPVPIRQARRYKTTKKVTLTQGNLVLDCPVPTKLLDVLPKKNEDEFTSMRYTAVTCDPNDFSQQNYTLRPKMLNRETELFIVMTMYNVSCLFLFICPVILTKRLLAVWVATSTRYSRVCN